MIRLLLCEDQTRFRALLRRVLSGVADFKIDDEAATGEDACRLAQQHRPDLLLLDLELPGMSGLEVIKRLRPTVPATEILVLTSFADEARVFEAMLQGAAGYLVKGIAPRRLEEAIREVLAGGTVIEPRLARRFWSYFASVQGRSAHRWSLTAEELEVLALLAQGLSNPEAARAMGASRRTIKSHLESVYRKLGVSSRVQAVVAVLQAGLIPPGYR